MKSKKILNALLIALGITSLSSCGGRETLLFLNWGEYIDESVIEKFEDYYHCNVIMDLADSNEKFYSKISAGTTVYDVVCPSDYMVEKMYDKNMLAKLDFSKIPNFNKDNYLKGVASVADTMEAEYSGVSDYYVPYLWGTWGIMYSTEKKGLEESILSNENEWSCLFDRSTLPSGTRVAQYDSYQHVYYAVCKYLGYDNRKELSKSELDSIYKVIKNMSYDKWGTDVIKKDIVAKNADLGFMWTGDFLYYYCENVADIISAGVDSGDIKLENVYQAIFDITDKDKRCYVSESGKKYDVGFDLFIPQDTIAFVDNLVVPKDSQHKDLAHKFINFMIADSVDISGLETVYPAYANTYYVCYNAPYLYTYNELVELKDYELELENGHIKDRDLNLYDYIYDVATGIAFSKYYDKDEVKGSILAPFDRKYINEINNIFNNGKI